MVRTRHGVRRDDGAKVCFDTNAAVLLNVKLEPIGTRIFGPVTRETGAKFGGELASDGLGAGAKATVDGMFRHNVTTIVEALK